MRLVSFYPDRETEFDHPIAGALIGPWCVDLPVAAEEAGLEWGGVDLDLGELLDVTGWEPEAYDELVGRAVAMADNDDDFEGLPTAYPAADVQLAAPIPRPSSMRDFYAFEQHVKAARARRGLDIIPEWYDFPVFYFTNHNAVLGPDDEIRRPKGSQALDFELEIACVIGDEGMDISAAEAEQYIVGYTIMNDWSARDLQKQEMKLNLGPAKGKDFATSLGPWVATLDELEDRAVGDGRYDLKMVARINGKQVSEGNFKDITFSFGQMIERASANVQLLPGDVIGSGTVGTGCILELGPENVPWLEPGDVVELEIERLGVLRNTVT